jgi:hypothetical protein
MLTGSLIVAVCLAGTYKEAQDILCANYPQQASYIRQIAPPTVGFKKRTWLNLRHLVLARGETRLFAKPNIKVSISGGINKLRLRLRHEFMHWIIFNTIIPDSAHAWVDHYWTGGT